MKPLFFAFLIACGALAAAQTEKQTHKSPLGYSYAIPSDWQVVDMSGSLSTVKQQAQDQASEDVEKRGASCVNMSLTARHGASPSVMVIVELPFDCLGQTATEKDLPGFAMGASEGLKQNFDLGEPQFGSYKLGTHSMWVERAQGTPKGHPELNYTIEVTCSLLKKAAVCWMAMAADAETLKVFEAGPVTLEEDPATALVPATAFEKKPGQ